MKKFKIKSFCKINLSLRVLKKFLFLSWYKTLVIVFDFLLIPLLNLPEKLILSFTPLILLIDITSCKSQNVTRDLIL